MASSQEVTIVFLHRPGGVLTDTDSPPVLTAASEAYGVRRVDTQAVVVDAGEEMSRVSVGRYEYTFTVPESDLSYEYGVEWVYDGDTFSQELTLSTDTATYPSCDYLTWDQLKTRWGIKNLTTASNKDNRSTDPDYAAVQMAMDLAVDTIHNILRGGIYAVPLDFGPAGDVVSPTVTEWCSVLTYEKLYNARGLADDDNVGNDLSQQVQEVLTDIGFFKYGQLKQLPCELSAEAPSAPGVAIDPDSLDTNHSNPNLSTFWAQAKTEVL